MSEHADTWPAPESACLTPDRALRFAAGSCDDCERIALDVHVDRCSDCQQLLAAAIDAVDVERAPDRGPRPGTELCDRYRLLRPLGRGGMGEVFEAFDRVLHERVALKLLAGDLRESERAVRYFKAEVQLARRIAHPNVCRVFDVGVHEWDGRPLYFLSMELIRGETLRHRLQREQLALRDVARWGRERAAGLCAAHRAGVLHRDFKSDNVLLRDNTSAVITDFGLARSLRDEQLSPSGRVVGSAGYMAPEQVRGAALSPATDLYAFGVVLFEMLTGELPFRGATPLATALLRLTEPPSAPSRLRPPLPPAWDELVLFCLARDPRSRPSSAHRVLEMLERIDVPRSRARRAVRGVTAALLGVALSPLLTTPSETPAARRETRVNAPPDPPLEIADRCEPTVAKQPPAVAASREPAPRTLPARARVSRPRVSAPKPASVDALIDPFE